MRQLVSSPGRLRLLAGAVVAGAALFASGVFVANAMDSDSDDRTNQQVSVGIARDGAGQSAPAGFNTNAPGRPEAGMDADARAGLTRPHGGCQVPIAGLLTNGTIDPAAAGFSASFLGDGFQLTSITFRGEADCPDGVTPTGDVRVVMDTAWKHSDTGLTAYVSQRQDGKPSAAVLEEATARFWRDGYAFSVNVDGYSVQPLTRGDGGPDIARDLLPGPDPRAPEVLRAALASLNAPAEACFYTVREGTLADLPSIGLGDIRSAIPSGYVLQHASVRAWNEPAADCGAVAEGLQTSFDASWILEGGDSYSAIYASAYGAGEGSTDYPGSASEYYASWSNGTYYFNIGVKAEPLPAESDVLRSIALALDPGFASACIAQDRELTDAEFSATGIGRPAAPDGYSISFASQRGTNLGGDCSSAARANYHETVSGNWTLTGPDGAVINVNAYKSADIASDGVRGYIGLGNLSWTKGSIQYNVSGYNERGGDAPSEDTLVAVALSMDPSFDRDSLEKVSGGGTSPGGPGVMPLPAEDDRPR